MASARIEFSGSLELLRPRIVEKLSAQREHDEDEGEKININFGFAFVIQLPKGLVVNIKPFSIEQWVHRVNSVKEDVHESMRRELVTSNVEESFFFKKYIHVGLLLFREHSENFGHAAILCPIIAKRISCQKYVSKAALTLNTLSPYSAPIPKMLEEFVIVYGAWLRSRSVPS